MNEPLVSQDEIFSIMPSSPKKPNFQYQTYLELRSHSITFVAGSYCCLRESASRIAFTRLRADSGLSSTATLALGPSFGLTKSMFNAWSTGALLGWS